MRDEAGEVDSPRLGCLRCRFVDGRDAPPVAPRDDQVMRTTRGNPRPGFNDAYEVLARFDRAHVKEEGFGQVVFLPNGALALDRLRAKFFANA